MAEPLPGAQPSFSDDVFARRLAGVRQMMASQQLDALLVYTHGPFHMGYAWNVEYLLGTAVSNTLLLVPASGDLLAWVLPKAVINVAQRAARCEVRPGGVDFARDVRQEIAGRGWQRGHIGLVEMNSLRDRGLPHLLVDELRDAFPEVRFPTVTDEYERVRLRLQPEEADYLERAGRELDHAMTFWTAQIRPGVAIHEAVAETRRWAGQSGVQLNALSARAAPMSGGNFADPGSATRVLQEGDYVFFESNAQFGPLKAYRGFPIALGDPPPATRNLFETALEVTQQAAAALRPGGTTADIQALGALIEARGLATNGPIVFSPATGGWQMICQAGFDGYREPTPLVFEPGMWFQDDPHLCSADWSQICIIGNTVIVGETGPKVVGEAGFGYLIL